MSLLKSIRGTLALGWELCEREKTAAEKVVRRELAQLHDGLVQLEAKVVIISLEEAVRIQAALAEKSEQLTTGITVAQEAQASIDASNKKVAGPAAAPALTPAPVVVAPVADPAPIAGVDTPVTAPAETPAADPKS